MAIIELPKDAKGREIPLDTKILYSESGKCFEVNRFTYSVVQTIPGLKWGVVFMIADMTIAAPSTSRHRNRPTAGRSWKRTWVEARTR